MTGLGALAVGAAPLAGGLLLGGMAGKGNSSVADLRAVITSELDLLQQLPEAEVARRAALKRMIGEHVDALLVAQEKSREFQSRTRYFTEEGHWRDIVLFVTILANGMDLLRLGSNVQMVILGMVLILAVVLDRYRSA